MFANSSQFVKILCMHGYSLASASIVATKIILKSKFSIAAGLVKTNHFKNGLRTKMKGLKRAICIRVSVNWGKTCTSDFFEDYQTCTSPKDECNLKSLKNSRVYVSPIDISYGFSKLHEKPYHYLENLLNLH
jgi:hypothetical protein